MRLDTSILRLFGGGLTAGLGSGPGPGLSANLLLLLAARAPTSGDPSPQTIPDAIHDRIAQTPDLVAFLANRTFDIATPQPGADGIPVPYLILNDLGITMDLRTTGRKSVRTYTFQADFVAETPQDCWRFLEVFRAAFHKEMAPLIVPGKTFLTGMVGRAHTDNAFHRGRDRRPRIRMMIPLAVTFLELD